jgi:hypothetical protein
MDQDDPEKRIADLERQHADPVGQPLHDPAGAPSPGSPAKASWGRRLLIGLLCALFPGIFFGVGLHSAYAYRVGTPTTATNVFCTGGHHRNETRTCTGTWSVDGRSHTGYIEGGPDGGSSLDVRVHGDTAYAAGVTDHMLAVTALMVGMIIVAFSVGFNYQLIYHTLSRGPQRKR